MIGTCVGPYLVIEKLGAGGMGEVYLAEDRRLHRQVALKRLAGEWLKAPEASRRLLHEARAAAQLNHPNVAAVYDVLELDGVMCIVMEYVRGETLARRMSRERIPPEQVREIGIQIADALVEAHGLGIIHRDLKPSNISLKSDGTVKVLDFGIARLQPVAPGGVMGSFTTWAPSAEATIAGTPGFMAPEQLLGKRVDHRADLYGLGVVMFNLLTNRLPYEATDALAVALAVVTNPTPRADALDSGVPADLSAIVFRAMAKDPAERYQSAAALQADLRGKPREAAVEPAVPAAAPPRRSRWFTRARLAAAAVAVAMLGTIVAWLSLRTNGPEHPGAGAVPIVAVLPLSNISDDPSKGYLGVGVSEALIADLARVPSIAVVPRAATAEYRDRRESAGRIGRELGAMFVVDGGVQQAGDRLRVTIKLVRPDDSVAWGDVFEDLSANLFQLQNRIAEGVMAALAVTLTPAAKGRLGRPLTTDVQAYAEYSQGRALLERRDLPGNVTKAIEAFQRAIARDPGFALAQAGLGEAYWAEYEETKEPSWTDKAVASILEALRLDPEQAQVRFSLATIYQGTGRSDAALEELRRGLESQPNSDEGHRLLGDVYLGQGKFAEAIAEYQTAIRLRPDYWLNQRSLGVAYYRAGRPADAAQAWRRWTELQPSARAFHNLGTAYHQAGNLTLARENYARAIALGSTTGLTYSNLGTIDYDEGRYEDAVRNYRRAIELDSTSPATYGNLGDAYTRLGRASDARIAYEQAVAISLKLLTVNPKDARTLARLAVHEAKLGRSADAARHAEQALALNSLDGEIQYKAAVVYALAGDASASLEALGRALAQGYDPRAVVKDKDMVSVADRPEFRALLARQR